MALNVAASPRDEREDAREEVDTDRDCLSNSCTLSATVRLCDGGGDLKV
jgi:hypothetical protein